MFYRRTSISKELIRWVMSYGSDAMVLGPEVLREEIVKEMEKMREVYNKKVD